MFDLLILAIKVSEITAESYTNADSFLAYLKQLLQNYKVSAFLATYLYNEQFIDIYNFVAMAKYLTNPIDRVSMLAFQKKCARYFIYGSVLFVFIGGMQKRYIVQKEVSELLRVAYNLEGYQQLRLTIKKLKGYYQLRIVKDAADYILGCI